MRHHLRATLGRNRNMRGKNLINKQKILTKILRAHTHTKIGHSIRNGYLKEGQLSQVITKKQNSAFCSREMTFMQSQPLHRAMAGVTVQRIHAVMPFIA